MCIRDSIQKGSGDGFARPGAVVQRLEDPPELSTFRRNRLRGGRGVRMDQGSKHLDQKLTKSCQHVVKISWIKKKSATLYIFWWILENFVKFRENFIKIRTKTTNFNENWQKFAKFQILKKRCKGIEKSQKSEIRFDNLVDLEKSSKMWKNEY